MKVSEITTDTLAEFIRIDAPTSEDTSLLNTMLTASKVYVESYTGLPLTATETDGVTPDNIDAHEDVSVAVMVLVQDMWDNRTMYVDKNNVNKVVQSILDIHCRNLVA